MAELDLLTGESNLTDTNIADWLFTDTTQPPLTIWDEPVDNTNSMVAVQNSNDKTYLEFIQGLSKFIARKNADIFSNQNSFDFIHQLFYLIYQYISLDITIDRFCRDHET